MSNIATREELLAHYAQDNKTVQTYHQYDVFDPAGYGDPFITPDQDGDCLLYGLTDELRTGGWVVRVHVGLAADKTAVVRMIRKVADLIETNDGPGLDQGVPINGAPF